MVRAREKIRKLKRRKKEGFFKSLSLLPISCQKEAEKALENDFRDVKVTIKFEPANISLLNRIISKIDEDINNSPPLDDSYQLFWSADPNSEPYIEEATPNQMLLEARKTIKI